MGWTTTFKPQIYLNGVIFNSLDDIDTQIYNIENKLSYNKRLIHQYTSASLKDIVPPDHIDDPIYWLDKNINNILSEIEDDYYTLFKLNLFKNHIIDNNLNINDFNPLLDSF